MDRGALRGPLLLGQTVPVWSQFRPETAPGRVLAALRRKRATDAKTAPPGAAMVEMVGQVTKLGTVASLAVPVYLPTYRQATSPTGALRARHV